MLTESVFKENFALLCENFNFQASSLYMKLVFDSLKNKITDKDMRTETCRHIEKTTMEQWNKAYGFAGKPAVADWIDCFVDKPLFTEVRYYEKCPITGANLIKTKIIVVENNNIKEIEEDEAKI